MINKDYYSSLKIYVKLVTIDALLTYHPGNVKRATDFYEKEFKPKMPSQLLLWERSKNKQIPDSKREFWGSIVGDFREIIEDMITSETRINVKDWLRVLQEELEELETEPLLKDTIS